jgi:lycopene beta-cyclase
MGQAGPDAGHLVAVAPAMTYFGFLARYIVAPTLLLRLYEEVDLLWGRRLPAQLQAYPHWPIIMAHAAIAVIYTTAWDNYLVATKVWWYDKQRVTGKLIGYVPIEEYSFFILQPLLTGAWLSIMGRQVPPTTPSENGHWPQRKRAGQIGLLIWLGFLVLLFGGWRRGTYLSLLLTWALPPLLLQTFFGGDILWRNRRLLAYVIIPTTVYLAAADQLAISNGNWTINPQKTLGIKIFGKLPLEELLFFLLTNVLIAFGVTLMLDQQSKKRALGYAGWLRAILKK